MLRLYFIGIIILVSAIILNIIAQFLGLKTWYDFLNGIYEKIPVKSLINFWDVFWLFFLYPFLLGLSFYLGDVIFKKLFN
tara:strand:+ start:6932 stop:7171 length:240 start_codon:yes stop_codon:yes gene_type:complete